MAGQSEIPWYHSDPRIGSSIADLLVRQGDIQAQRAQQVGNLWANAVGNVGNIAAGAVQQHQEQQKAEKRKLAFNTAVSQWDGKDPMSLYRSVAPIVGAEDGYRFAQGMVAISKASQGAEPTVDEFKVAVKAAKVARKAWGDDGMAEHWPATSKALAPFAAKFMPGIQMPEQYTPEIGAYFDTLDAELSKKEGADASFTLTPGAKRFDASGKMVAEAPVAPKEEKKYQVTVPGPNGPVTRLATEAEMAQGVKEYQKPVAADQPSYQAKDVLNDEGKAVIANFNAKSGQYVDVATGKPIKNPRPVPSAAETQDTRKFKQAAPILSAVSELSEKINTLQGVAAKASGEAAKQAAKLNLNDNVAEYEALISGFTPLVARALGHTGVLTQQDVDSVKALFPRPGDSKSLRDRKVGRIKGIIGQLEGGEVGAAPPPGPAPTRPKNVPATYKWDASVRRWRP